MGAIFYICIKRARDRIKEEEKMKLQDINESKHSIKNSLMRKNVDIK